MSEKAWSRRIGLADIHGTTMIEFELDPDVDGDPMGTVYVSGGAFRLQMCQPDPSALRQVSAAALDLADRMERGDGE